LAILYPELPANFNDSWGEREVFESLRSLDDTFTVFHSLAWLNTSGGTRFDSSLPVQGEADFVLISLSLGVLVVEVKSGGIRCQGRQWYQTNTATGEESPIQDPLQQANRSAHFLRKKILANILGGNTCGVYHAVWFPSVSCTGLSYPIDYDPAIVLDCSALANPLTALEGVFNFWQGHFASKALSAKQLEALVALLAPTFNAMPAFQASMEARERHFVRMTSEQARCFEFLDDQPQALIGGPAGCGKTVLAIELCRRLAADAGPVLYLCYNSALRKHLRSVHTIPHVSFETFHSYAGSFTQEPGLDYAAVEKRFLEALADDSSGVSIPNLVIDEGQDFPEDWIDFLKLRTAGRFFVFFDRNQLLFQDSLPSWFTTAECRLVLKRNCRNTRQIATTVDRAVNLSASHLNSPTGLKPQLYIAATPEAARSLALTIVKNHISEHGLSPTDFAVLTAETNQISCVAGVQWPCPVSDEFGNSSLCCTTIKRFKGLEAKIVIVVDVAFERMSDEKYRRLLYVGFSRAVHELHIIARKASAETMQHAAEVLAPSSRLTASARTVAFLLAANLNKNATKDTHV